LSVRGFITGTGDKIPLPNPLLRGEGTGKKLENLKSLKPLSYKETGFI
jgi:hypothetical protein